MSMVHAMQPTSISFGPGLDYHEHSLTVPTALLSAGMYLGEVTRRILLQFAEETGLFGGLVPQLQTPGSLSTPDTSKIDHDGSFFGGPTADVLRSELGLSHWQTFWDRQLVGLLEPLATTACI